MLLRRPIPALCALLLLGSCAPETSLPTPPVVVAGWDVDTELAERIPLVATAADADGEVVGFEWRVLIAPDGAVPGLEAQDGRGELIDLLPGGVAGLYVLQVHAVDDHGLRSEPDFLNVLLRTPPRAAEPPAVEAGDLPDGDSVPFPTP